MDPLTLNQAKKNPTKTNKQKNPLVSRLQFIRDVVKLTTKNGHHNTNSSGGNNCHTPVQQMFCCLLFFVLSHHLSTGEKLLLLQKSGLLAYFSLLCAIFIRSMSQVSYNFTHKYFSTSFWWGKPPVFKIIIVTSSHI